jgi:enoyl-CoA hydratase/carnithine racemase
MSEHVREELHGPVAVITVDRPPVNAYNREIRDGIHDAVARFDADPEVRAIVLTATGTVFSGGQDMEEPEVQAAGTVPYSVLRSFDRLCDALTHSATPTICAVNGSAVGGGLEVVLACDLRVAAASAKFGAVGAKMGLIASSQRLVRIVGEPQAKLLALTARRIDSARALEIGLVHEVVQGDSLLEHAIALGTEIAGNAPLSVARAKAAINRASEIPLADGLRLQREFFLELSQTDDHKEAVRAFREKRPPEFRNR